jgi:3-hydroxy acid dehydrogenase / malonic semialdehyde reductase
MAALGGRNALVTGAGSGIGKAIASALVERGARVTLADLDDQAVTRLAKTLGSLALPLKLDVTDHPKVDRLLEAIPPDFRPIDILINNAGHDVGGRINFARGPADDWTSILDVNLTGMVRVTRAVVPEMIERNLGDIVNMSSISALRLVPETAAYTTSKAGVRAFSDALRADLSDTAIRVTEVLPGLTRTNIILKRHRGDRELEKAYFDQAGITLDPEDIARMVLFALEQPPHMQIAQLFVLPVNRW